MNTQDIDLLRNADEVADVQVLIMSTSDTIERSTTVINGTPTVTYVHRFFVNGDEYEKVLTDGSLVLNNNMEQIKQKFREVYPDIVGLD